MQPSFVVINRIQETQSMKKVLSLIPRILKQSNAAFPLASFALPTMSRGQQVNNDDDDGEG